MEKGTSGFRKSEILAFTSKTTAIERMRIIEKINVERKVRMMYRSTRPSQGR